MTNIEAIQVRAIVKSTKDYNELVQEMPKFGKAIEQLPDISLLRSCNVVLRDITADALCQVRSLPYGSITF